MKLTLDTHTLHTKHYLPGIMTVIMHGVFQKYLFYPSLPHGSDGKPPAFAGLSSFGPLSSSGESPVDKFWLGKAFLLRWVASGNRAGSQICPDLSAADRQFPLGVPRWCVSKNQAAQEMTGRLLKFKHSLKNGESWTSGLYTWSWLVQSQPMSCNVGWTIVKRVQ